MSRSSAPKAPKAAEEFPCHLCLEGPFEFRKWIRHYDIHFPPFFWHCGTCKFTANQRDGFIQHCRGKKHRTNIEGSPELSEQLNRNKFWILDGGHERCIYCDKEFKGLSHSERKTHIIMHLREDTAESLSRAFNHRCKNLRCGEKDYHWRRSKYVTRILGDADDDTLGTSRDGESEGGDGNDSTGTIEDEDELEGDDSTSEDQGRMGGGGEGRGGGRGGMRGSRETRIFWTSQSRQRTWPTYQSAVFAHIPRRLHGQRLSERRYGVRG